MKPDGRLQLKFDEEKGQNPEQNASCHESHTPEQEGLQGMALIVVMTSICLCMFLVSLVSIFPLLYTQVQPEVFTNHLTGSHHHRDRNPQHDQPIPLLRRHRLVRQRIPPHRLRHAAPPRPALQTLPLKDHLPDHSGDIRNRLRSLRRRAQLQRRDRRPSDPGLRVRGHLLGLDGADC